MFGFERSWRGWLEKKWLTSYRLNHARTVLSAMTHRRQPTRVIFVLGCQRSGTTMLAQLLGLCSRVKAYGEGDDRYFYWDRAPRLKPLRDVRARLLTERSRFTLLKPLCESQRADQLLQQVEGSRAVWIFRDYRACVASHIKYYGQFHDGRQYIRELLNTDTPSWKNEHLAPHFMDLLRSKANQSINVETGYALYWLARNSLCPGRSNPRIKVVCYEKMIREPAEQSVDVFRFLEVPYDERYAKFIVAPPASQRDDLAIDADVCGECEKMYRRLVLAVTSEGKVPAAAG